MNLGQKWYQLEHVAVDEGKSVGDYTNKTLNQCKVLCEQNVRCASFAYSYQGGYEGDCHLKDKIIHNNEPQKTVSGYGTYYLSFDGNVNIYLFLMTKI